jgi:hypothetical protein
MRNKGYIVLLAAGFVAAIGAPPRAQAARLVCGPNFPVGGVRCARSFGQPAALGTGVFLENGCLFSPNNERVIGGGGLIVNSGKAEDGGGACLDEAAATAGAAVVVNPCAGGQGRQARNGKSSLRPDPTSA